MVIIIADDGGPFKSVHQLLTSEHWYQGISQQKKHEYSLLFTSGADDVDCVDDGGTNGSETVMWWR